MKAIILAAGRGSRMGSMTDSCPKCLAELDEKTLLSKQLKSLSDAGIDQIAIVTGYKSDLLAGYADYYFHNDRWAESNMVTSLSCADEWLSSEPCIVSYSDIFYEPSAVTALINSDAKLAITYDPSWLELWESRFDDPLSDAETFKFAGNELLEIGEQPKSVDEVQGQYMGLLRFTPESWQHVKALQEQMNQDDRDRMHMTGTLSDLLKLQLVKIQVIPYSGPWGEVDSQSDLAYYHTK